jgi:hypothetical protein
LKLRNTENQKSSHCQNLWRVSRGCVELAEYRELECVTFSIKMAQSGEDVYSWLLASADQLPYPTLEPNPLDADSIGEQLASDILSHEPLILGNSHPIPQAIPFQQQHTPAFLEGNNNSTSSTNSVKSDGDKTSKTPRSSYSKGGGKKTPRSKASGTKRAAVSGSKKDDKSRKRAKQTREDVLERNRRSARECRERKKERVAHLENRVKRLEQENMQLRVQLRIGRETDASETAEKWRITNLLGDMIKEGKPDDVIDETIQMFTERYADYGKERRVACRYHLDYLEKLLVPTQVTKMGLWSLDQEDEFYEADGSSLSMSGQAQNSIWHILCNELDLTEEQKQQTISHRGKIRSLMGDLKSSLELLSTLRDKVEGKNEALEAEMKILQSILTPKQAAKFILWVSHNPACMQMLNKLWEKLEEPAKVSRSGSPSGLGNSSTEQVSSLSA